MELRQCVLVVLFVSIAACAQGGENTTLAGDADALLERLHKEGSFSGAVMIGRDGAIAYEGAFGMADQTRPFALDTAADGASLAKTVTAAVIWRLIDEGSTALDDPVQDHLAEFPYANVTIRHLLSHTAGLPDYDAFQPLLDSGKAVGNLDLQEQMRRSSPRPLREPGTAFSYCNICYDTLALLAERVTGASYSDHAVKGLLGGLGARDAFLRPVQFSDWPQSRTIGFRSSLRGAEILDVFDNEAFYGGSNIYFTVRDLHAWANAWVDGRALPPSVVDRALEPARIAGDTSAISLASWYCAPPRDRCYYTGHHQGFFNFVYWDASRQLTVVFVSNNTMAPPLHPWLMRTLVAMAEGREAEPAPSMSPAELEVDVDAVAGHYRIPGAGDVQISVGRDGPAMQIDQGPEYRLYQVGYGVLYAPGLGASLSFERTGDDPQRKLLWTSVFTRAEGLRRQS